MKITSILAFTVLAVTVIGLCGVAVADTSCCGTCYDTCCETCCEACCRPCYQQGCFHGGWRARQAAYQRCVASWYGSYSHVGWGAPLTLVVPPTAKYQTNWGWGVGNTRVSPIYPQFGRQGYGTGMSGGSGTYRTTPRWPTDTTQFGVYYARGPW